MNLGVAVTVSQLWVVSVSHSALPLFSRSVTSSGFSVIFTAFFSLFLAGPCIGDMGRLDFGTWRIMGEIQNDTIHNNESF